MATIDYHWQRFSFGKKLARFSVYLFFITGFLFSIRSVEVIPEFLYDAPEPELEGSQLVVALTAVPISC